MSILKFKKADIPEVAEIENLCFSVPWSAQALEMLTQEPYCAFVLRENDKLAAYGGMLCVAGEAQMLNIATSPEFRRRGYARQILFALCKKAKECGAVTMSLEVRESNTSAQSLYISEGFEVIGIRKNYYVKPQEAAIIMEKKL